MWNRLLGGVAALLGLPALALAGEVPFGPPAQIASGPWDTPILGVEAGDLDGDGDADVVVTFHPSIIPYTGTPRLVWYPNADGHGSLGSEQPLGLGFAAFRIRLARVDGDPDLDVIAARPLTRLGWWENAAGDGSTWTGRDIGSEGSFAAHAVDLDGDGDTDVVSVEGSVVWYENEGGTPPAFTSHAVSSSDNWDDAIGIDLDGDDDVDVLAVTNGNWTSDFPPKETPVRLVWLENDGNTPPAFSEHEIDTSSFCSLDPVRYPPCNRVYAADLDGDGDVDPIFWDWNRIVWYENDGASPPSFTARPVPGGSNGGVPADVDRDGDLDLIGAAGASLVWFENDGASPPGWTSHEVGPMPSLLDLAAADLDGDGDLDVLASGVNPYPGDTVAFWFENRLPASSIPALPAPALVLAAALLAGLGWCLLSAPRTAPPATSRWRRR